jgi:hypothetical protein
MTAWIALLVSIAVALVGFFSWRTAHQKMILDIFEKRFAVYEDLIQLMSVQIRESYLRDEDFHKFVRALDRAKFLFGRDVSDYLHRVQEDLAEARRVERDDRIPRNENAHEVERDLERYTALHGRLAKFYADADLLFVPYMKIHQRSGFY